MKPTRVLRITLIRRSAWQVRDLCHWRRVTYVSGPGSPGRGLQREAREYSARCVGPLERGEETDRSSAVKTLQHIDREDSAPQLALEQERSLTPFVGALQVCAEAAALDVEVFDEVCFSTHGAGAVTCQ